MEKLKVKVTLKAERDLINWVTSAYREDCRYCEYVKVDGFDLIRTDGHRLHKVTVPNLKLPIGVYSVKTYQRSTDLIFESADDLSFPDYKNVIPDTSSYNASIEYEQEHEKSIFELYSWVCRNLPDESCINFDYFKVVVEASKKWKVFVHSGATYKPIVFENNNMYGLIMAIDQADKYVVNSVKCTPTNNDWCDLSLLAFRCKMHDTIDMLTGYGEETRDDFHVKLDCELFPQQAAEKRHWPSRANHRSCDERL